MPDIVDLLYTTDSGPGYAFSQEVPAASIGGFASNTPYLGGATGDLFGQSSSVDLDNARADYRCLYVYNPSYTSGLTDVRIHMVSVSPGSAATTIGVDPRPVTAVDSSAAQAVEPVSIYAAPGGVTFTAPSSYASGIPLGNLGVRMGRAIWIRRVPVSSGSSAAESIDVVISNGVGTVLRRVYWSTEVSSTPSAPYRVPTYVPTPTPVRRVNVDFVTSGNSRITWEVDRAFGERGPYRYQLQCSQSGGANATDWIDVGPPVQDAVYLIDPERRLWGVSSTLHYRIILNTADGHAYTSPSANVYGMLNKEQWLIVREVYRKESLMLRRFTGVKGYLLKAKRYGTPCTCVDPVSYEIENSSCPDCYGTGILGGYETPIPYSLVDTGNESFKERVAYNENLGTIGDAVNIKGRALAFLPLVHRDAWIAEGSDRRYYIHRVAAISARLGVPIVYDVELRFAARSDVLYTLPIIRPPDDPPYWQVTETIPV